MKKINDKILTDLQNSKKAKCDNSDHNESKCSHKELHEIEKTI